jgi:hypothetical protein
MVQNTIWAIESRRYYAADRPDCSMRERQASMAAVAHFLFPIQEVGIFSNFSPAVAGSDRKGVLCVEISL